MDNKSTIIQLEEQERNLLLQLSEVRSERQELIDMEIMPELKKKYLGKHFKYKNCYSCPSSEADYWFLYVRVDKVDGSKFFTCFSFQTDTMGITTIQSNKYTCIDEHYIKISKREFTAAYNKMQKSIDKQLNKTTPNE